MQRFSSFSLFLRTLILPFAFCLLPSALLQGQSQTTILLRGDFPDPTILRDGDLWYMTHSSYDFYPGLLIWKSSDLVNWERVTRALHTDVGNVWAPELIRHNDLFYLYFPTSMGGNFVITASNIEGPWSEPVHIDVRGIDPGHVVGKTGERYLYLNNGRVAPLADDGLSVTGPMKRVYEGWNYPLDWGVECFCLESPKLVYREPWYYMTSAQGGTSGPATSHMAVAARSKDPLGPWENSPYNPVVRTWKASEPWVSKGHGTIFADANDRWYIVYHAYERGHLPMGRSTLVEPVEWTSDGWYKSSVKGLNYHMNNSNLIGSDDFSGKELKLQWAFSNTGGNPFTPEARYHAKLDGEKLILETPVEGMVVMHAVPGVPDYEATVKLEAGAGTEAGLILYFTDEWYAGLAIRDGELFSLSLGKEHWGAKIQNPEIKYLKLRMDHYTLFMSYSEDGQTWHPYEIALEVSGYQKNVLGGFSSLKIGIYGKGGGKVAVDEFTFNQN